MYATFLAPLLFCFTPVQEAPDQESAWDQGYRVAQTPAVLPYRDRAEVENRILRDRLDNLLPTLMREAGLDMWLVICREYAEDPVYLTLVPSPVFAARRTTILVFNDLGEEEGVERLTVSRYGQGDFYNSAWEEGGSLDEQWARLAEIVAERDPERIGINVSDGWATADGLSAGLRDRLFSALGPEHWGRTTSAENLVVRWLETRTPMELEIYPQLVHIARSVISEAFSERVITPGVTTTADVRFWIRDRFEELGLDLWFQPAGNVQRMGWPAAEGSVIEGHSDAVIQRGDLLHTDVGIHYLRLCTDTQEMGYVLRPGEADVPEGLKRAMAIGNRWQDLLTTSFELGRTGNEILAATRAKADAEGITCSVYTHPLGFHGHGSGPTIGMWDNQGPTPLRGDWPLHADTCYAIEGNVTVPIPEWGGQQVQIKLEQDGWFDGEQVHYIGGRQTEWHVVR
ncbi:MAG: M24 family metallopeptidase [Planctomycetota bacterium]|jgi:Xaa-Pro aminopeptidase